ncbi:PEP-CTERM sorting domain-containing protein [Accumulibacter sp.]
MLQVPEPGMPGVFGIGLLVLALSSRRRLTRS